VATYLVKTDGLIGPILDIIENIRRESPSPSGAGGAGEQIALFSDFNGLPFDDMVDFYHHEQHWANRMILGDSLLVMTSLAEKEGLKGKVQTIYFDPPYGIKFGSNWQVSTRKRDVKDGKAEDATRQPEQIKAFRDTWQLGIHSYLAYLRDRLTVARELLTESGSIFVQIGDENVHLVRSVLDEVFGSENYTAIIAFKKPGQRSSDTLPVLTDFILWYAKDSPQIKYRQLFIPKSLSGEGGSHYTQVEVDLGVTRTVSSEEQINPHRLPDGAKVFETTSLTSAGAQSGDGKVVFRSNTFYPPRHKHWSASVLGVQRLALANRLDDSGASLRYKRYFDDFAFVYRDNRWDDAGLFGESVYVVQTSTTAIQHCILMSTDPGDLVLDPTCGSGTTAYVAEQWGRRWITIDTSRVAVALARTRLMAARYPYYLLADSAEGRKREQELTLTPAFGHPSPDGRGDGGEGDIKRGFVYRRVPHITLKSIANNEEIDAIHAGYQAQMEPLREQLNKALKQTWEEWEIPRTLSSAVSRPSSAAEAAHARWWELRRERQKAIDLSIAKRAETELLYDQPYEDNKRIRVAGPFTVESLSPHRVLPSDDGAGESDAGRSGTGGSQTRPDNAGDFAAATDFVALIIDNLKKAGVQNTVKKERLKFDTLEPYAGTWLQAAGTYTESGKSRHVAVSIGPEHGTVGPDQVKDAAKEAVQGVGFDLLIVCGFAFDPHVGEEAKRYGKLTVLTARMNPDLAMGDELLKKTGAGNLFMVFGEPDIAVKKAAGGKLTVTLKGVDVYDPTTGQIRSNGTDDIACWFIDTNYNGESFFVRHAYFTGAEEPYERLKRALRAEIDEAAWSALYQTASQPFDPPATGKIAVKVINHYGDEVMRVEKIATKVVTT
jgi:adenine-specific DNA-methyltransferase